MQLKKKKSSCRCARSGEGCRWDWIRNAPASILHPEVFYRSAAYAACQNSASIPAALRTSQQEANKLLPIRELLLYPEANLLVVLSAVGVYALLLNQLVMHLVSVVGHF